MEEAPVAKPLRCFGTSLASARAMISVGESHEGEVPVAEDQMMKAMATAKWMRRMTIDAREVLL